VSIIKEEVQLPDPRGAVNDYAGILSEGESGELASMVTSFFHKTDVPIVIAIIQSTGYLHPSEYAFLLYNHWGIGEEGVNRGALFLLCIKDQHLESEIGSGLEPVLPEEEGDAIVAEFISSLSKGNYFEGLKKGTQALIKTLQGRLPSLP
jgi:uncharacterized protein